MLEIAHLKGGPLRTGGCEADDGRDIDLPTDSDLAAVPLIFLFVFI